jgi:hypothetical protein
MPYKKRALPKFITEVERRSFNFTEVNTFF